MKFVNLVQGSPEWLAYRKNKIGASDFAVIAANRGLCSSNLYNKSLSELGQSKIGKKIQLSEESQKIMQEGHDCEERIRSRINETLNFNFVPCVVESTFDPFMASLDGYDKNTKSAIEIKYITARRTNFDGLLDYYLAQLIHQYYVMYEYGSINIRLYLYFEESQSLLEFCLKRTDDTFQLIQINNRNLGFERESEIIIAEIKLSLFDWRHMCYQFYESYMQTKPELEELCIKLETLQNESKTLDDRIASVREQILLIAPLGAITSSFSVNPIYKSDTDYQSWSDTLNEEQIFLLRDKYVKYDYVKFVKDEKIKVEDRFKIKKFSYLSVKKLEKDTL